MELKTDSKIFNELLKIVNTYNEVYTDGISSYINLHNSQQIKNIKNKKKNTSCKRHYEDSDENNFNIEDSDENLDKNPDENPNKYNLNKNSIDKNELEKKEYDSEKEEIINIISNAILDSEYSLGLEMLSNIKNKIGNYLIAQVLDNSPQADIIITKFPNIKTELYPYQINNLNWMLNIENKKYSEHYNDLLNKILFRGGGLFDEVGMGKTLQIITLINTNVSQKSCLIYVIKKCVTINLNLIARYNEQVDSKTLVFVNLKLG